MGVANRRLIKHVVHTNIKDLQVGVSSLIMGWVGVASKRGRPFLALSENGEDKDEEDMDSVM